MGADEAGRAGEGPAGAAEGAASAPPPGPAPASGPAAVAVPLAVRRPWAMLLLWLVLMAGAFVGTRGLGDRLLGSAGTIAGSEAHHVDVRLSGEFDSPYAQFLVLAFEPTAQPAMGEAPATAPVAIAGQADATASRTLALLLKRPEVLAGRALPEGDPWRAALLLGLKAENQKACEKLVKPLRAHLAEAVPAEAGVRVKLTGVPAISQDLVSNSSKEAAAAEQRVLPWTFLALLLAFGAPLAAILPLGAGVGAVLLALGALGFVTHLGPVSVYSTNLISMLGLGLGIDYALFMVARVREEARKGTSVREAVALACHHAMPALALSAGTVFLGLLGLALSPGRESSGMGLGGMLVAASSALVVVTLLPALLAFSGRGLNWPERLTRHLDGERGRRAWGALARAVVRRPWLGLAASLLILLPMAYPLSGLRLGDPEPHLLPHALESVQAVAGLKRMGLGSALMPMHLLVEPTDGKPALDAKRLPALANLAAILRADRGIGEVFALVESPRLQRMALVASLQGAEGLARRLPPEGRPLLARDGSATVLTVIMKPGMSLEEGRNRVMAWRQVDWAERLPGLNARLRLGGPAAASSEFIASTRVALPRVLGAIAFATLLMIYWQTRSVLLPIKALLANALTVAAALGATHFLFSQPTTALWLGLPDASPTMPPGIPLISFCVVFGLSMDYEIILLARILEAHREGKGDAEAVAEGLAHSGSVITAAAVIMALVFVGFCLTAMLPLKLLGTALVLGVILDATVVRMLLVPSLMAIAGRWNWWPGPGWRKA